MNARTLTTVTGKPSFEKAVLEEILENHSVLTARETIELDGQLHSDVETIISLTEQLISEKGKKTLFLLNADSFLKDDSILGKLKEILSVGEDIRVVLGVSNWDLIRRAELESHIETKFIFKEERVSSDSLVSKSSSLSSGECIFQITGKDAIVINVQEWVLIWKPVRNL